MVDTKEGKITVQFGDHDLVCRLKRSLISDHHSDRFGTHARRLIDGGYLKPMIFTIEVYCEDVVGIGTMEGALIGSHEDIQLWLDGQSKADEGVLRRAKADLIQQLSKLKNILC